MRIGRPPGSFRKRPQTGNWTFRIGTHVSWVGTSNQFRPPCNSPFLQVWIFLGPENKERILFFPSNKSFKSILHTATMPILYVIRVPRFHLNIVLDLHKKWMHFDASVSYRAWQASSLKWKQIRQSLNVKDWCSAQGCNRQSIIHIFKLDQNVMKF